jgi:O-methyltransferase
VNPIIEKMAQRAYSSLHTVYASFSVAITAHLAGIKGDIVECGVAAGANAAAMAFGSPGTRVHLFDSFAGIPQAGPHDVEFLAAGHKPGLTAHSRDEVESNMREWGIPSSYLVYHEGMFADTIPRALDTSRALGGLMGCQIAVLRLDGDLYESTKVCLEHLYPLLSPGGWCIVDDFDLSGAKKAVTEYIGGGFGPVYWVKQQ